MRHLLLFVLCGIFWTSLLAQTFTGPGGAITDQAYTYYDLNVSGLPSPLDTSYGLESICIDIEHTRTGELDIRLIAPDGSVLELSTGNGGTGDDYSNTCFAESSPNYIQNGDAPFAGFYHPEGLISSINNGQDGNGLWQLWINDFATSGTGSVISWQLTFGSGPPAPFSSNLPIVKIFTNGQVIPDEPKILVKIEITDNGPSARNYFTDPGNDYNGWAGMELRGSSSMQYDKKSFGFETTDSLLNDTNVSILGMPLENDWILNANFTDKTMMRNVLAYHVSQQMGHYAARWRFTEVFLNGQYRGIYILSEKIKRDNNRVDIANLTQADTTGDDITGGYILKIDKSTGSGGAGWLSAFPPVNMGPNPEFLYEYPDEDDILPVQADYIQNFIDSFEIVLNDPSFNNPVTGYRSIIDVGTFIDYFLVNEISKNIDGYRISTFMHKDKDSNGGLLKMGPVWDYDIAWGNANYYNGQYTFGWSYEFLYPNDDWQVPFWWDRLLQDTQFTGELKCRWDSLRSNLLSDSYLFSFIDSLAAKLDESQQRNFMRWPILGVQVGPNPMPIPIDYAGEIDYLKNFITGRMTELDIELPGVCTTEDDGNSGLHSEQFVIYPNPSRDKIYIHIPDFKSDRKVQLNIYSIHGMLQRTTEITSQEISLNGFSQGIYIFEFREYNATWREKVVIQ